MGRANLFMGTVLGVGCVWASLLALTFALPVPPAIYRSAAGQVAAGVTVSGLAALALSRVLGRNPTPLPAMRRGVFFGYVAGLLLWLGMVLVSH